MPIGIYIRTEEMKQNIGVSRKGHLVSVETREKIRNKLKGHPVSQLTREAIANSKRGKPLSEEHKGKLRKSLIGKKLGWRPSEATRRKISLSRKGSKSNLWRGGVDSDRNRRIHCLDYRLWREAVLIRDNYTCQDCFEQNVVLCVHHLIRYEEAPELFYIVSNGLTLCSVCHRHLHVEVNSYDKKLFALAS